MTNTTTKLTVGLIALAMFAGCRSDKDHLQGGIDSEQNHPFFEDEKAERATTRILNTQRARGAAADGMLYAVHFDGSRLNSLGREKLDAMRAAAADEQPVRVHLNLPEGDTASASREQAVMEYLGEQGLEADRIQVVIGPNESSRHLASLNAASAYERKEGQVRAVQSSLGDDAGSETSFAPVMPGLGGK